MKAHGEEAPELRFDGICDQLRNLLSFRDSDLGPDSVILPTPLRHTMRCLHNQTSLQGREAFPGGPQSKGLGMRINADRGQGSLDAVSARKGPWHLGAHDFDGHCGKHTNRRLLIRVDGEDGRKEGRQPVMLNSDQQHQSTNAFLFLLVVMSVLPTGCIRGMFSALNTALRRSWVQVSATALI